MKMHIIMALLALALLPAQATAQEHWSCDTHAYRYDMTLYVALMEDGKEVLIPAIKQCILDVDIEEGTMRVHLLGGML